MLESTVPMTKKHINQSIKRHINQPKNKYTSQPTKSHTNQPTKGMSKLTQPTVSNQLSATVMAPVKIGTTASLARIRKRCTEHTARTAIARTTTLP